MKVRMRRGVRDCRQGDNSLALQTLRLAERSAFGLEMRLLDSETQSLATGALLYTFGRSLVSITETSSQPAAAFPTVSQELHQPVPLNIDTSRRINAATVVLHCHPGSAWLIIKNKVGWAQMC